MNQLNLTTSSINVAWINPKIDYDYLILNYTVFQSGQSNSSTIQKNINSIWLTGFLPGSLVQLTFSTIKNGATIGLSDTFYAMSSWF